MLPLFHPRKHEAALAACSSGQQQGTSQNDCLSEEELDVHGLRRISTATFIRVHDG